MEKTLQNIINFAEHYKICNCKDKHNKVWLEAQIGNQLKHYREEIIDKSSNN